MSGEDTSNSNSMLDPQQPVLTWQSSFARSFYRSNLSSETVNMPLQEETIAITATATATDDTTLSSGFGGDDVYTHLLQPNKQTTQSEPAPSRGKTHDLINDVVNKMDADFAESDNVTLDPSLMTALRLSDATEMSCSTTTVPAPSSYLTNQALTKRMPIFYMDLLENGRQQDNPTNTPIIPQAPLLVESLNEEHQKNMHCQNWNDCDDVRGQIRSFANEENQETLDAADDRKNKKKLFTRSQSFGVTVQCKKCGVSLQIDLNVTLVFCPSCRTVSSVAQADTRSRHHSRSVL